MTTRTAAPPASVVKCSTPADLLRLVPALVGVPVHDSVVLVLWNGTRTHGAMRLDLPATRVPHELRAWAAHVLGSVCKVEGAEGVTPVVFTDRTFAPTGRLPHADLLRALNREAGRMGLEVRDLQCVAADGWGSLRDPGLPRGGRPLAEIAPQEGDPVRSHRAAADYPVTSAAAQEAFDHALRRWWTDPEGPGGTLHGVDLRRPGSAFGPAAQLEPAMQRYRFGGDQADVVALVEGMLEPHDEGEGPCPCRALLFALATRQGLENLVLLQFGWGRAFGLELWDAANAGDAGSPVLARLQAAIGGGAHPRPDVERVDRAIAALIEVGGLLEPEDRAPVDGMLAWLHWALGGGSVAGALADRALALEPGRDIPTLIAWRTRRGELPEWAYRADPTAPDPLAAIGRAPGLPPCAS